MKLGHAETIESQDEVKRLYTEKLEKRRAIRLMRTIGYSLGLAKLSKELFLKYPDPFKRHVVEIEVNGQKIVAGELCLMIYELSKHGLNGTLSTSEIAQLEAYFLSDSDIPIEHKIVGIDVMSYTERRYYTYEDILYLKELKNHMEQNKEELEKYGDQIGI